MDETILHCLEQLRHGQGEDAYFSLIELDHTYVPTLIEAFQQEEDISVQTILVEAIWQHRLPESLPFLQELLHYYADLWKDALDGIVAINNAQGLAILAEEKARLVSVNDKSARERIEWINEAYNQLQENLSGDHANTD